MAYVCRLEAYRGALNLGKCVDYDIPGERIRDIHKFNLTDLFPLPDGRLISVSELYDHTDEERSFMGKCINMHQLLQFHPGSRQKTN